MLPINPETAKHLQLLDDFDIGKRLKLALVHGLGEIDAGDTFLYGEGRQLLSVYCIRQLCSAIPALHN